jgi:hypothetical protein
MLGLTTERRGLAYARGYGTAQRAIEKYEHLEPFSPPCRAVASGEGWVVPRKLATTHLKAKRIITTVVKQTVICNIFLTHSISIT